MTHPLAALIGLDMEDVARAIYDAMRFERRDKTPDWVKGGNSNAQVEARATAARILAALEAAPVPDLVDVLAKAEKIETDLVLCFNGSDHVLEDAADTIRTLIALATAQAAQIAGMIDADTVQKMLDSAQPIMAEACRGYEETIADLRTDVATLRAMQAEREAALQELRFHVDDAVKAWNAHEAAEAKVAELEAQIAGMQNEKILSKATYDGVSSLLLSVQQDCIAEHQRAEAAEAERDYTHGTNEVLRGENQRLEADAATLRAEVERLRGAAKALEKAASEVSRRGAETGPQWSKLTIAILQTRAALGGQA